MKPDAKPDAPKNSLLLTSKYIDLCKHINAMLVQKSDKMKNKKVKSSQLGSTRESTTLSFLSPAQDVECKETFRIHGKKQFHVNRHAFCSLTTVHHTWEPEALRMQFRSLSNARR